MKIVGEGFNSPMGVLLAKQNLDRLNPLLEFSQDVVMLCQAALQEAPVGDQHSNSGKQQTIACVLLARILETAEAIICIARSGFGNEVNPLFRVFIEGYFIFGNVCKRVEFLPEYFATDLSTRQKIINSAIKRDHPIFHSLKEYVTEDMRAALKREIEDAKASGVDAFKYANDIGCGHIYDSIYRITSAEVHTTPRALAAYVKENPDGTIAEIYRTPSLGHIPDRLYDLSCFLLTLYSEFHELFANDVKLTSELYRQRLEKLVLIE